jgi:alpha-beta hydrolase superfamily lysophospholipase
MSEISGGDGRPHGTGGTFEGAGAVVRSADRERYERENAKLRQAEKPTSRVSAWVEELNREQAQKAKADADAIARGALKILPDGTRVESYSGFRRN